MDCKSVLKELESAGSAQTRKTYARHGVIGPMFGVSYKHLGILTKKLKTNHAMALELWASGNHDARVLATMVADAARLDAATAERWVKDLGNSGLTHGLGKLVSRSPVGLQKAEKWIDSKKEWISSAGWVCVAHLAMSGPSVDDAWLAALVPRIQKGIHAAANRTRYAMNMALIAIGVRNAKLRKLVLAAAKRIGKVEVDHGNTNCTTPDAAAYIAKTVAHRRQKIRTC